MVVQTSEFNEIMDTIIGPEKLILRSSRCARSNVYNDMQPDGSIWKSLGQRILPELHGFVIETRIFDPKYGSMYPEYHLVGRSNILQ